VVGAGAHGHGCRSSPNIFHVRIALKVSVARGERHERVLEVLCVPVHVVMPFDGRELLVVVVVFEQVMLCYRLGHVPAGGVLKLDQCAALELRRTEVTVGRRWLQQGHRSISP
jgi:hypothetical protein